jgi:hypothetical protein
MGDVDARGSVAGINDCDSSAIGREATARRSPDFAHKDPA